MKKVLTAFLMLAMAACLALGLAACSDFGFQWPGADVEDITNPGGESEISGNFRFVPNRKGGYTVFARDPSLSGNLEIPKSYKDKPVNAIGNSAFQNCELTGDLRIPDSVIAIGNSAFDGCRGLTGGLRIPDGVTSIGDWAFRNCSGLTGELVIPDSVTAIGINAFQDCNGLTGELKLPKGLTEVSLGAFSGCSGLTGELKIPKGVTKINTWSFTACGFTSVTIPSSVTVVNTWAFWCDTIESVSVEEGNRNYYSKGNCLIETASKSLILGSKTGKIPEEVTSIGIGAFAGCSGLTGELKLPKGLTSIGNSAFENCSGLTGELEIPEGVTSIGQYAFRNCAGLTDVTLPSGLEKLDSQVFMGCSGLTDVTIPLGLKELGDEVFLECSGLTDVIWEAKRCSAFGRAFRGCIMDSIIFGENVEDIPLPSFDEAVFKECIVREGNSAYSSQNGILYNKDKTKIVYVPLAIQGAVTIPESITSIGDYAFKNCSELTSIELPNSVTSIKRGVFMDCTELKAVYYKGSAEEWSKIEIGADNGRFSSATVYYFSEGEPDEAKWQASEYWWHYDPETALPTPWTKNQ